MKIQLYKVVLIICILVSSCYNVQKPKEPKDLLSEDEMVNVLLDIAIINSSKSVGRKNIENAGVNPENYVFKKHNIDSTRFAKSNEYYTYDMETYKTIYARVHDSLKALKTFYEAIEVKEKKEKEINDSIKRKDKKLNKQKLDTTKLNQYRKQKLLTEPKVSKK